MAGSFGGVVADLRSRAARYGGRWYEENRVMREGSLDLKKLRVER